ncbi:cyclic nucleotide-binding domain-containing protein [Niastella populi]|uniref:Cyclic nucleotide-binding domain-containing protein n=1 Tax=Niastella populi TaxID=550983 RepID=A0A1V9FD07_9BACT|nr:cyclic nucleotide-binding domain-containing protein [Niastella populi]OQP56162.1 hypothetical protein A4R26_27025 [Niastella populi]
MTTYDHILKNANRHITLSGDEIDYFTSLLMYKEVSKKSMLLVEGQTCNQLSFVQSGALRSYCLDKEGKESTIMFAVAGWWQKQIASCLGITLEFLSTIRKKNSGRRIS